MTRVAELALTLAVTTVLACRGELAHRTASTVSQVYVVSRGHVVDRVLLAGELHAAVALELRVPRTDVWMLSIRWLVADGARVKTGDRLVELDNSQFTQQLEQKRLALTTAELTLSAGRALATAETAAKELELQQHQIELEKVTLQAAVPADLLGAREAQDRQLKQRQAQVAVDKATQDLAAQKAETALDLRVKELELEKAKATIDAADKAIAELVMTAPHDGLAVIEDHPWLGRKLHATDQVQPGMAIVSLPDESRGMRVRADLSDVDDGKVTVGMTGSCTLDAYPHDPVACTVDLLTPVARPKTGQGSLRRTFTVELALAKSDSERMIPGMSVEVELHASEHDDVLVVPRGAILRDGAATRVRIDGGQVRDIVLGTCDAQRCVVERGLAPGEHVTVGDSAW